MKKKTIDLKSIWERAAKTRKLSSTFALTPEPITIGSQAQPANDQSSPSIHHEVATNDSQNQIARVIEMPEPINPVVASNEPMMGSIDEPQSSEHLSPIRDGDEPEYESTDEAIYDIYHLIHDPGKRFPINSYDVNERNSVIRRYIALGPCQPQSHDFPMREIGGKPRCFDATWFYEFSWLEYSMELDAAFCFECYLFKHKTHYSSGDAFVVGGFRNWHMKKRIELHVGDVSSYHNAAFEKYHSFMIPKATIVENFASTTKKDKVQYLSRLTYSLKCLKFLLCQGLACRGHDESEDSQNKGNFLELLNWLAENFEEVGKVVLKNVPQNCILTAPQIQRDIINCCAKETTKLIMEDLGSECFAILADESSDVYQKEQLALCL
jgi:hypothetical protein